MAEYIDREALLQDIKETVRFSIKAGAISPEMRGANKIIDRIKCAPAADVVPVRHGRWDDIPNEYMSVVSKTGAYHGNATTCSVCHEVNPNAFKTNYCPNCGAKMDGGARVKRLGIV